MSDSNCTKCNNSGKVQKEKSFDMFGSKRTITVEDFCDCEIGQKLNDEAIKKIEQEKNQEELLSKNFELKKIADEISIGFGSIYVNAKLEDFPKNSAMDRLELSISGNRWIYLYGDSRAGKTHLAAAIYKKIGGTITNSVDLDTLISNYDSDNREREIKKIAKSKILFIDDIGVGKLTHERHRIYYYIINYRNSNNLKTIITSNHKTTKMWEGSTEIDPIRIVTRIQESSDGYEVKNRMIIGK